MSDPREEKLPDQALINQKILSQLDAIDKRLTVIENKSASPAKPKAKKIDKKESGNTKYIISYNQLNITQWMAGFCRIMKEESCQVTKDHMLDYLIALLNDSNDFSPA